MAFDVNQQENGNIPDSRMDLDKYGVWVRKAPCNVEEGAAISESPAPVAIPPEEVPEAGGPAADASPIDDFESMALEETSGLPSFVEEDGAAAPDEDGIPPETFIDTDFLDDFTNDIPALAEGSVSGPPAGETVLDGTQTDSQEEEVSIDEFLGGSGEIDLEDPMDEPAQGKSDIQDEIPMDMDLTFDDDFTVDEAGPADRLEDAAEADSLDDFDEMFDGIVDEAEVQAEEPAPDTPAGEPPQEMEFDEVNDFDDLLDELSDSAGTGARHEEAPQDFVMEVAVDDDEESDPSAARLDEGAESVENMALAMDDAEKTDENRNSSLDRLQITDYTETSRMPDDDFDIDKIMSEAEDIGETTSETVEEPALDDVQAEESQDTTMEMPEEAMEFDQNEMEQSAGSRTEELISSIASEIALLRDEIASLRSEFEAFKGGRTAAADVAAEPETQAASGGGGFFADTTDDDTIALSGDELSNIFNTADFTEESVDAETQQADEESDNGLPPMDFDSETLEEPVIEDNYFDDGEPGDLPDEIDVPTGIADRQDEVFEEIELDEEEVEVELQEPVPEADGTFDAVEDQAGESAGGDETVEEIHSIPEAIEEIGSVSGFDDELDDQEEILDEMMEDVDPEAIFEEELSDDGLADDAVRQPAEMESESIQEIAEEPAEEAAEVAEAIEEEITDEPTEAVFESGQWDAPADDAPEPADIPAEDGPQPDASSLDDAPIIEEPVDTVSVAEEELLKELEEVPVSDGELDGLEAVGLEAASDAEPDGETLAAGEGPAAGDEADLVAAAPASREIPEDLKNDIKSVLLYMDQLLDSLPEEKIAEFARSEHFELYKKLFAELGLS